MGGPGAHDGIQLGGLAVYLAGQGLGVAHALLPEGLRAEQTHGAIARAGTQLALVQGRQWPLPGAGLHLGPFDPGALGRSGSAHRSAHAVPGARPGRRAARGSDPRGGDWAYRAQVPPKSRRTDSQVDGLNLLGISCPSIWPRQMSALASKSGGGRGLATLNNFFKEILVH